MTRDEIFALLERRNAAWSARDADALTATHSPDGIVVSPTGGVLEGHVDIARVYRLWFRAFPDIIITTREVLIDGNRVAQLLKVTGTHAGEFFGLAPSGRRVEAEVALLLTVRDGVVVEERRVYDFTGLLVQIGVLKAKPASQ